MNLNEIMIGMTIMSFICVLTIGGMYFPQKRLSSYASKTFSLFVIASLTGIFFDLMTYFPFGVWGKIGSILSFIVFFIACVSVELCFAIITNYCYLMTYAKKRKAIPFFSVVLMVPVVVTGVLFLVFHYFGNFIICVEGCYYITRATKIAILHSYYFYAILDVLALVLFKNKIVTVGQKIIYTVCLLEGLLLIWFITKYDIFFHSMIIALDCLLIYIQVQYPQSYVDRVTKLFDRTALDLMLNEMEHRRKEYYVVILDVKNFKHYNSQYGEEMGNAILQRVADELPDKDKKSNSFHLSNDIFMVLSTEQETFYDLVQKWSENKEVVWQIEGNPIALEFTVIFFHRTYTQKGIGKDMVSFLEEGLEYIKRDPANNLVFINDKMDAMNREKDVRHAVERALKKRRYEMYFQPIFNCVTKKFDKAEALVRLIDEEMGFIPPDEFIRVAEQYGLVIEVGRQVINKTFSYMWQYGFSEYGVKSININLSSLELSQPDLLDYVLEQLNRYNLRFADVTLEVTETAEVKSEEEVFQAMQAFHKMGFEFALDDYGTGYSNIERIVSLPLSYIKIDKTLLNMAMSDAKKMIILEKNVEMLKACGYKIVVEGAETKEQVDILQKLGVDYIQGYYYSKPLPVEDYVKFVKYQ